MRQGFSEGFKRISIATAIATSLGLTFSACGADSGGGIPAPSPQPPPPVLSPTPSRGHHVASAMTLAELVKLSGNPCDSPLVDSQCMNDEDDIRFIPDCEAGGYHAVVSKRAGAALLNKVPPRNDIRVSVLAFGKVVCVQGIARIGAYPAYLFVTAETNLDSRKCEQVAPGRFEGSCAIGWVDRDDMELIDNTK